MPYQIEAGRIMYPSDILTIVALVILSCIRSALLGFNIQLSSPIGGKYTSLPYVKGSVGLFSEL